MAPKQYKFLPILFIVVTIAYLWMSGESDQATVVLSDTVTRSDFTAPSREQLSDVSDVSEAAIEETEIETSSTPEPSDGIFVQGQLIDELGKSIEGMQIEISPKNIPAWQQTLYRSTSDHRGEFLFDSIPANIDYRLEVLASGNFLGTLLDPFPVFENMTAETIMLESIKLVTVNGMMVGTDGTPVSNFEILVQNVGIAYPTRKLVSDSSGFFELNLFPIGELQLTTSGDENFNITGIRLNPGEYRNLTLVFDKGHYHLSGWLSDEFDAPIAQARVALESNFLQDDYQSSSFRFVVTDSNGGFSFSGLGGRDHQISIDAIGYQTSKSIIRFRSNSENINIQLQRK